MRKSQQHWNDLAVPVSPLYVYFPPRTGEPVVLSQVLTEQKVVEVLT